MVLLVRKRKNSKLIVFDGLKLVVRIYIVSNCDN